MKAFDFIAYNSPGEKKLGTVRARSLSAAKREIQRNGFYLASRNRLRDIVHMKLIQEV